MTNDNAEKVELVDIDRLLQIGCLNCYREGFSGCRCEIEGIPDYGNKAGISVNGKAKFFPDGQLQTGEEALARFDFHYNPDNLQESPDDYTDETKETGWVLEDVLRRKNRLLRGQNDRYRQIYMKQASDQKIRRRFTCLNCEAIEFHYIYPGQDVLTHLCPISNNQELMIISYKKERIGREIRKKLGTSYPSEIKRARESLLEKEKRLPTVASMGLKEFLLYADKKQLSAIATAFGIHKSKKKTRSARIVEIVEVASR